MRIERRLIWVVAALLAARLASHAGADLPVTGHDVPALRDVDDAMQDFMADHDIQCGLVGIMRNGVIVYQRGFGWMNEARTLEMQDNAVVRLASGTKAITAAAIRTLEVDGLLSASDFVFSSFRGDAAGILDTEPFLTTPANYDSRHGDITVEMCIQHRAGWDYTVEDAVFLNCEISAEMGVESPPAVDESIAWLIGRPLQFSPNTDYAYSNSSYLVLGRVVEVASGRDIVTYHRSRVLTPDMWVPATDLLLGESFFEDKQVREPWYEHHSTNPCVFARDGYDACDPDHEVPSCYGSWDMATYFGSGGIIASAPTMLELAERYELPYGEPKPTGYRPSGGKSGNMSGCSSYTYQRSDGVNVFVFFNEQITGGSAIEFYNGALKAVLDGVAADDWPTTDVGGFWIDPEIVWSWTQYGSYDIPFGDVDNALWFLADGSRVNFHPGTSSWTGTLSTKLLLKAPLGSVVIGG